MSRPYGPEWNALARRIRQQRGCCARCGSTTGLRCHHVKRWLTHPHLRLDPANIEVLCHRCYRIEHRPVPTAGRQAFIDLAESERSSIF